jgi:hypothetical protein
MTFEQNPLLSICPAAALFQVGRNRVPGVDPGAICANIFEGTLVLRKNARHKSA